MVFDMVGNTVVTDPSRALWAPLLAVIMPLALGSVFFLLRSNHSVCLLLGGCFTGRAGPDRSFADWDDDFEMEGRDSTLSPSENPQQSGVPEQSQPNLRLLLMSSFTRFSEVIPPGELQKRPVINKSDESQAPSVGLQMQLRHSRQAGRRSLDLHEPPRLSFATDSSAVTIGTAASATGLETPLLEISESRYTTNELYWA